MTRSRPTERGPFRADQLKSGDPYELHDGHPLYCAPVGGRGSSAANTGALVLATDPAVQSSGVETGFSPEPGTLWAPDIAVGNVGDAPGWVNGVPALAVEYADRGQDEVTLRAKIADLLAHGTRLVWVVRLAGPRRVEVHAPGEEMRVVGSDGVLAAPGVLANAVPVAAMYDRDAAIDATLANVLQRAGYAGLDQVRDEGREEGRVVGHEQGRASALRASLQTVIITRGFALTNDYAVLIEGCREPDRLQRWFERALTAPDLDSVFRD